MNIRPATDRDADGILELYRRVAAIPGGLARLGEEVDRPYVEHFLAMSIEDGVVLVAVHDTGRIVGEIHAYSPGLYCFSHVLSELTIAVDPDMQGGGIGRRLFESLIDRVVEDRTGTSRIELIARESNGKALAFYESLGFVREGRLAGRIRNVDGSFESDIPMGWTRPPQQATGANP